MWGKLLHMLTSEDPLARGFPCLTKFEL
jgi:hypothetical protein